MQTVLDQGQKVDWFQSEWICQLTLISAVSMIFFIIWELYYKDSIIDLRVFKNINYTGGCILGSIVNFILFGTLALLPLVFTDSYEIYCNIKRISTYGAWRQLYFDTCYYWFYFR